MQTLNERLLELAKDMNTHSLMEGALRAKILAMIAVLTTEVEKEIKRELERQESLAREREFKRRERLTRDGWEYGQRARGEI